MPQNAKMHYNFGNLQRDLDNVEGAVKHYREAIRYVNPQNTHLHSYVFRYPSSTEIHFSLFIRNTKGVFRYKIQK